MIEIRAPGWLLALLILAVTAVIIYGLSTNKKVELNAGQDGPALVID